MLRWLVTALVVTLVAPSALDARAAIEPAALVLVASDSTAREESATTPRPERSARASRSTSPAPRLVRPDAEERTPRATDVVRYPTDDRLYLRHCALLR